MTESSVDDDSVSLESIAASLSSTTEEMRDSEDGVSKFDGGERFDSSSESLAGKSESFDVGGSDDPDQFISTMSESFVDGDSGSSESIAASLSPTTEGIRDSEENVSVNVEEAEKEIEDVGKFENVSVNVEDKEVIDEKLVFSYGTEKEEIGETESEEEDAKLGKFNDDEKSEMVVEEEIMKFRDVIVDSSAIKALRVHKTTLTIEEPDDPSALYDVDFELDDKETSSEAAKLELVEKEESLAIESLSEVYEVNNADECGNKISAADIVSTREFSLESKEIDKGSSKKSVVGFRMAVSDEETEEMMFGSSESGEQFLDRIDGNIVTDSDEEEDKEKKIDTAALSEFIKAVTSGGYSDGTTNLSSMEQTPAGLGLGLGSSRRRVQFPAPRTNLYSNLKFAMGEESERNNNLSEEDRQKLEKLQAVRVKYLRLLHRLGVSIEDSIAAEHLTRLSLLASRHSGELFNLDAAKKLAMESESEEGKQDLDFSLNILVLGKSGVGKSATINSIFGDDQMANIDAFRNSTASVKEISGIVNGVKITIIDTPGLKSSAMNQTANLKILSSVKKVMKKCPPDLVLYVDRLDAQSKGGFLNDLPLLKTITASLGSSIWTKAIVTLTHSDSTPPDGPSGTPMDYEEFAMRCSDIIQHSIGQALGLMYSSPLTKFCLVENHPSCQKNRDGEKVLPNGIAWRRELLLSCYSGKILSDAISLLKQPPQEPNRKFLGFSRIRFPPLSSLLSWLLQSHPHPKLPGDNNIDSDIGTDVVSDSDEDEYDQLPPFKPLRKTQLAKLSKKQKKAYFDEYDYRVKLLQKKELKRIKEMKKKNVVFEEDEEEEEAMLAMPLPEIVLPDTFDSDDSTFRYRSLEQTSSSLLVTRTELEAEGWDHDYGYDSVIAERSLAMAKRFPAQITVQMTKDKKEFNICFDSSVCAKHGDNGSTMGRLLIQGSEELLYLLKGETKFKKMILGGSTTFSGKEIATGVKLENEIKLAKRLVLFGNVGTTRSQGRDSVYEANLEVRLREADSFPIVQNQAVLGMCLKKSKDDFTLTGTLRSQVSIGRQTKLFTLLSLDNKKMGRISVRTSSLDQLQIALMAILPIAKSIYTKVVESRED